MQIKVWVKFYRPVFSFCKIKRIGLTTEISIRYAGVSGGCVCSGSVFHSSTTIAEGIDQLSTDHIHGSLNRFRYAKMQVPLTSTARSCDAGREITLLSYTGARHTARTRR